MLREKRKQNMTPIIDLIKFLFSDGPQLSESQKKKCFQKFESFKPLGSSVISKDELRKVLKDMGKKVSEEELFSMVEQADPNGYGYINYNSFSRLVQLYKQRKDAQINESIGLTYEDILKQEKKFYENDYISKVSWEFLQSYLIDHFDLEINLKTMRPAGSPDTLNKDQFKNLFT